MFNIASHLMQPLPTNDVIARYFLIHFQEHEMFFNRQMKDLRVKHCLRIDHTFKVASNIGYLWQDGKWVTQYSSVLMVLNEEGQAVAWQLTNSTSLDEVYALLCNVKEQIEMSKDVKLMIYVDNCCQVRKNLKQVFGVDTIVKLDVLHAVQCVTHAMSKNMHCFMHVWMILGWFLGFQLMRVRNEPWALPTVSLC